MGGGNAILNVRDLRTSFYTRKGEVKAVDGVSFAISAGECLGLVGESGCGKSVTALSIMGIIREPGRIVGGEVLFCGRDLVKLPDREMRRIRGRELAMIFQHPGASLNPMFDIGEQVHEALRMHREGSDRSLVLSEFIRYLSPFKAGRRKDPSFAKVLRKLKAVGISDVEQRVNQFPHQMSGGMKQRIMIAMALANNPKLLIADEPTTSLDVTTQAVVNDLIRRLQLELGTAVLLITHDLGVVAEMCDKVAVMYCGRVVETGGIRDIFRAPAHPYTQGLIACLPRPGDRHGKLYAIPGSVPHPLDLPRGCHFAPRCGRVTARCMEARPEMVTVADGHQVACFNWTYSD